MRKVYLDTCCLNRPLDKPAQPRIIEEAKAVIQILRGAEEAAWLLLDSEILRLEIEAVPDMEKQEAVKTSLSAVTSTIPFSSSVYSRAADLTALGFRQNDALHLACAESGGVEVFLTVDDRLLKAARRFASSLAARVLNPVEWLQEVSS